MTNNVLTPAMQAPPIASSRTTALLVLATLTSVFSILDRSVLSILAEPIKQDLRISDTQLGLLTGFAFVVFYAVVGIPIARYVDRPRTHRPRLVAACLALWSSMTILSGFVTSYAQLLLARIMLGVGESGSGPALFTLINDSVPQRYRARAFAIYGLGPSVGILLGLVVGGFLAALIGWRMTFVAVGAPGLILALVIAVVLYEPRADKNLSPQQEPSPVSLKDVARTIGGSRPLLYLIAAGSMGAVVMNGLPTWIAVYLIRHHGLAVQDTGLLLGLMLGVAAAFGTLLGGVLADKLGADKPRRLLTAAIVGQAVAAPLLVAAVLAQDVVPFTMLFALTAFASMLYLPAFIALLQRLVAPMYRATTSVLAFLFINLIGAGLAPFVVGYISDQWRPELGADSLRWALMSMAPCCVLSAFLFHKATNRLEAHLFD